MGQSQSWCFPLTRRHHAISPPLLFGLPIELCLLVTQHLRDTPECIFTLALTCKTFYNLLIPEAPVLTRRERQSLLLLLERDPNIGSHLYFCAICRILHRFSPSWSPLTREHTFFNREHRYMRPCYADTSFYLEHWIYALVYHHARLVTNRHLYGAPCGLPLSSLDVASVPYTQTQTLPPSWRQSLCRARIIDDELFLCVTHTIDSLEIPVTDHALRSAIDMGYHYSICRHTDPAYNVPALNVPVQQSRSGTQELFSECRGVAKSCPLCLTDLYTTVERKNASNRALVGFWDRSRGPATPGWVITIVSYHQFGGCRSPDSWKWRVMVERNRLVKDNLDWRDHIRYPPGSIRAQWLSVTSE